MYKEYDHPEGYLRWVDDESGAIKHLLGRGLWLTPWLNWATTYKPDDPLTREDRDAIKYLQYECGFGRVECVDSLPRYEFHWEEIEIRTLF